MKRLVVVVVVVIAVAVVLWCGDVVVLQPCTSFMFVAVFRTLLWLTLSFTSHVSLKGHDLVGC